MSRPDARLETRRLDALLPRPNNEKQHTEYQLGLIVASIQKLGFNDPIEIEENGTIIAGMGRYVAALQAGLEEVPCLVHTGMTAVEVRAYGIAHNQTTLASGLDTSKVAAEFSRLGVEESEFAALGFSEDETIFFQVEQTDILEDDDIGGTKMDVDEWADVIPKTIRTKLVFNTPAQQIRFEQFMSALRQRYPNEPTMAGRFLRFMSDFDPSSQAV